MASPVPRCSTCSTNSMAMPGGACSIRVLVTHSARWPTTTTTRATDSSARASSTWSTMGRPHSRWRGLGRAERIRVPSPAASTTADSCRPGPGPDRTSGAAVGRRLVRLVRGTLGVGADHHGAAPAADRPRRLGLRS